jgi:hypothetical protein
MTWQHFDSLLIVIACTLPGGFDRTDFTSRIVLPSMKGNNTSYAKVNPNRTGIDVGEDPNLVPGTCGKLGKECAVLDEIIHPLHLFIPWVFTLCTLVVLSMPTVLLRSRNKEKGLRLFAGHLFQFLGLLVCCTCLSEHPSICYTFTVHACVRFLGRMEVSSSLVGGCAWWAMRYAAIVVVILSQLLLGPPISVVHWPSIRSAGLPCAYLSHLVGCLAPDMALSCMRCLIASARYIHIRDE